MPLHVPFISFLRRDNPIKGLTIQSLSCGKIGMHSWANVQHWLFSEQGERAQSCAADLSHLGPLLPRHLDQIGLTASNSKTTATFFRHRLGAGRNQGGGNLNPTDCFKMPLYLAGIGKLY